MNKASNEPYLLHSNAVYRELYTLSKMAQWQNLSDKLSKPSADMQQSMLSYNKYCRNKVWKPNRNILKTNGPNMQI
jgi:hypothetical protein